MQKVFACLSLLVLPALHGQLQKNLINECKMDELAENDSCLRVQSFNEDARAIAALALRQGSMSLHALDAELRLLEKRGESALLAHVILAAREASLEYFEQYSVQGFDSIEEALKCRYIDTAILYKMGMSKQASLLAESTFSYLFPRLHAAIVQSIQNLFGEDYLEKCHNVALLFLKNDRSVLDGFFRIKSIHSIWRKVSSLADLEAMTKEEFCACVDDFIGLRWELKVESDENRYDALVQGVCLAPLQGIVSFRNQQLKQSEGFDSEPIMKLYYCIEGLPLELQLCGGNLSAYMCAKGYANYKVKLSLPPKKEDLSEDLWERRLQMAIQLEEQGESSTFQKNMYAELAGIPVNYSTFDPFILESAPTKEKNRRLCFSTSSTPLYKLSKLTFEDEVQLIE